MFKNQKIVIFMGKYKALRFVATFTSGNYATVEAPLTNSGSALLSISECPGDISQTEANCVDGPSIKSRVIWANPAITTNFCDLIPGKVYYLNFFFGDLNGAGSCNFPSCATRGRNPF